MLDWVYVNPDPTVTPALLIKGVMLKLQDWVCSLWDFAIALCIASDRAVVWYPRAPVSSLAVLIDLHLDSEWSGELMCSWSQKSLLSILCPSLAMRKAVTAPSPEQSCEHTRSPYCCTCTDFIPSRVSAYFCSFSTQNIQCNQCTALRAGMMKKALLPLSILASMITILFCGHWGQTSLFFLSLFIPYHTWLFHSLCVCTGVEMSSCWLWGWGRCPSEQTCSLQTSFISIALC